MTAQILRNGDGSSEAAIVQIDPRGQRQDGVALEFEDGSGTIIAVLQGYVANIMVESGNVISVSYSPAKRGDQLATSQPNKSRADRIRALVATSAKFGVFRIDGPPEISRKNAEQLAKAIRVEEPVDPTLAIYATYAYADAGLYEQMRSLHEIMKSRLGIDLFDVAMLSGALSAGGSVEAQVPFCPMLKSRMAISQGEKCETAGPIGKRAKSHSSCSMDHLRSRRYEYRQELVRHSESSVILR